MKMSEQNEFNGFVDGQQVECVISYDKDRDLYECIVAKDGKIDNKFYSIKRSAMETIAKILTKWKE
tara:strand:- start:660 stop:857 length:198 start_codon:yes stop_codon:yes gene_type:complete